MTQTAPQINGSSSGVLGFQRAGPVLIVFGNEKGGSGKSTAALQTAIALLYKGYKVGTIDLDARQGTMTRYLRNRYIYNSTHQKNVPCPLHLPIDRSQATTLQAQKADDMSFLSMAIDELWKTTDFIVIDTPGADTHLNRLAHGLADVLVTPLNDSLIDLDVLASLDPVDGHVRAPSFYAQHVRKLMTEKERQLGRKTDWIVMRNRLSTFDTQNKQKMGTVLNTLSGAFGFRLAPGFGERLIFRDLFLEGLTMMDIAQQTPIASFTPSQAAAYQETQALMDTINPFQYKQPMGA